MDIIEKLVTFAEENQTTSALIGGLLAALVGAYATYSSAKKDRRRELFAEAYKAAIEWREMFYRLRRRSPEKEVGYKLIDEFHELQQRLDFYSGWLGSVSVALQGSYSDFVGGIKRETITHIHRAWDDEPVEIGERITSDEPQPNYKIINKLSDSFLRDVRRYQSPLLMRRTPVIWQFRTKQFLEWFNPKWDKFSAAVKRRLMSLLVKAKRLYDKHKHNKKR